MVCVLWTNGSRCNTCSDMITSLHPEFSQHYTYDTVECAYDVSTARSCFIYFLQALSSDSSALHVNCFAHVTELVLVKTFPKTGINQFRRQKGMGLLLFLKTSFKFLMRNQNHLQQIKLNRLFSERIPNLDIWQHDKLTNTLRKTFLCCKVDQM